MRAGVREYSARLSSEDHKLEKQTHSELACKRANPLHVRGALHIKENHGEQKDGGGVAIGGSMFSSRAPGEGSDLGCAAAGSLDRKSVV